jgi:type I restriction enzyme M protein
MEFPERFRWGWCTTTGKKGDLMFAQHMLSVCKQGGMVATVMPHGVLFRSSAEKQIRKKLLEEDLIEAIIGLPQNLFYGASIPACILVMRPNLTGQSPNPNKPEPRRGRVMFVNADAEYHAGRAQNYLRPEHIEKIVSTFDKFEDVPGYARVVPLTELVGAANDFNCNIRRYVDNTAAPEPHDVQAHLSGGVPTAEVSEKKPLFDAFGFELPHAFAKRSNDSTYYDFASVLSERTKIRTVIEDDAGVQARHAAVRDRLVQWWADYAPTLANLPQRRDLNRVRGEILDSFVNALLRTEPGKPPVLDRFKLAGVIATWWTDTLPDFKTLLENGFPGVVEGWVDAIADAVEDDEAAGPTFDPFAHKLVRRTMIDYLERTAAAKTGITGLKGQKDAFEQSNAPDDLDEEDLASWNYAKELERQARELKADNKETLKELKKLEKAAVKSRATVDDARRAEDAKKALTSVLDQLAAIDESLSPCAEIKARLAAVRAQYRTLTNEFVSELRVRCDAMTDDRKQTLVLELFAEDIKVALDAAVYEKRQELVGFVEALWDKYRVTLADIHAQRAIVEERLDKAFKELSYT